MSDSSFKYWRHETPYRFGINNRIGNLTRLLGDQASPNGITFRPKIFTFIIKTDRIFIDYNAEGNTVYSGTNTAIIERCTCINSDTVRLRRITNNIGTLIYHKFE